MKNVLKSYKVLNQINFELDNYRKYSTLMMGKQRSDCPLPCSTFIVEKKLLEAYSSKGTYLSLEFSPR